jgi:hypothetical protein
VVNQHGTYFWRTFWYLNGRLMPLNMICCIAQDAEKRREAEVA